MSTKRSTEVTPPTLYHTLELHMQVLVDNWFTGQCDWIITFFVDKALVCFTFIICFRGPDKEGFWGPS